MVRKQVLVEQVEVISFGESKLDGTIVYTKTIVRERQLGRCEALPEALPEAVAKVGNVSDAIAAEALSKPGERVLILEQHDRLIRVSFYLVVYLA